MLFATLATLTASSCALQVPTGNRNPVFSTEWIQEAEKKHGRVAMLAVPALAQIASVSGGDPIVWLNHQPVDAQLVFYSVAGVLESVNLRRMGPGFTLKHGERPGQLTSSRPPPAVLASVEDATGRLAMIVTLLMFVRSLLAS